MKSPKPTLHASPSGTLISPVVARSETLEDEFEHPSRSHRQNSKKRHNNTTAAANTSAVASFAQKKRSSSSTNTNTNHVNNDNMKGYFDEKAAIRNTIMVQGAGFRREKQDIVAALGHSPALLLTPSADIRLQRKLHSFNNNSGRSNNNNFNNDSSRRSVSANATSASQRFGGITVDGYSPEVAPSDPLEPVHPSESQEQSRSSRWSRAVDPVLCHEEEMPRNLSSDDIDEYAIAQAEIKRKRFRCYLIVGAVLALLLGTVGGIVAGLVHSEAASSSSGDECSIHNPANTGCIVPECARIKYEELKAIYPTLLDYNVTRSLADDEDCTADQIAANALAIRWTSSNNDDEMEDSNVYFALATFFFSLRGKKWNRAQNWLDASPVCDWHGINCTKDKDGTKDVIVALSLPDNHLVGSVPTQLGLLTSLQRLSLAENSLGGETSVPTEIGLLVDLEELDLHTTKWAGQLPSEIGLCTKLAMLDLWGTDLTGMVPTEIGNVKSLESLRLGSTLLAGSLPTEIGSLSRLTALSVFVLPTTGKIAIPSEVTLLSNIRHLVLNGVATTSSAWLMDALVAMTGLTTLSLANDGNLFGHNMSIIPTQIGRLTYLESMSLIYAQVAGTLPTEFARLTKLTNLDLSGNLLSGTIPTELGLLTTLTALSLQDNTRLTGFVPSEMGALTDLSVANFGLTAVSAPIPLEVCALGIEVMISELKDALDGPLIDACST